ncbi:MAG: hypothetical protein H0X13_16755 [Ramlibacter sp.]|nr:hypothetical protein [Ramlibacter sp.]
MDTDKDQAAPGAAASSRPNTMPPGGPSPRVRWRRETLVPTLAVVAVAVTAVVTSVVVGRTDAPAVVAQQADPSAPQQGVITAPPLKPSADTNTNAQAPVQKGESAAGANSMGAAAACRNCGVVQTVVAVHGYGDPKASSYQMHIRMDDGSTRTVEQRGALAAGSRVIVEGSSIRALPAVPPGQG